MSWFEFSPGGLLLRCYVQPGAARDEITGLHDGELRIRLKAPPVEGQANQRLCSYLAKVCETPKGRIQLLRGHGSRHKTLQLAGVSELPPILAGLPAGSENL